MPGSRTWKTSYLFALQEDYPVSNARYAQVGIQIRKYFTGYVHDYNGGGSWIRTWFLDGRQFESEYYCLSDALLVRVARRKIEEKYPGLCAEIDGVLKHHIYWRDSIPYARPFLRKLWNETPPGYLLSSGRLTPITIGNTYYDVPSPTRESLMVLEKGCVCLLAEFQKLNKPDYINNSEIESSKLTTKMEIIIVGNNK